MNDQPNTERPRFHDPREEYGSGRVIAAGIQMGRTTREEAETSLAELVRLIETAGATLLAETVLHVRNPDPATMLSRGKVEELGALVELNGADGVVIDGEVGATHQRNLEEALGVRVIDRTLVILDIFAKRARSKEGKIQVEVAQLRYRLPRLSGRGTSLSRLGGGIGTRGPGETKLEVDRRRTQERLRMLEGELDELARAREVQRKQRDRSAIPAIVLIGYTNAGKSTLLNGLTQAGVFAEDLLFATLDPTTRIVKLPSGTRASFTDTVGFIHNLPKTLIAAFHATLEEVARADLLLHLIDASSPTIEREIAATDQILEQLGAKDVPRIRVWNKVDLLDETERVTLRMFAGDAPTVQLSALKGDGYDRLLERAEQILSAGMTPAVLRVAQSRGDVLSRLRELSRVRRIVWKAQYAEVHCSVPKSAWRSFEREVIDQDGVTRMTARESAPPPREEQE